MKRPTRSIHNVLAGFLGAVSMLFAFGAHAALIHSYNHSYTSSWGDVTIDLNVFDGQAGGRYLWQYTVHNIDFAGTGGANGFSGFELYLPTSIPGIADITPNGSSTPPWDINCCSGHPTEWDIQNSVGNGVMPGETGVFSFTTDPRQVAINNDGWFHTWVNNSQTDIVTTFGMHVPWVPGLTPLGVPEPSTLGLMLFGVVALGVAQRRRRAS